MPFSAFKNSSLLSDTLEEQEYMTETLQKMDENRDENQKLLKQKKSLIIKQISAAKSKVLFFFVYFLLVFFLYRFYFCN
jgi:restriction endonuclease S subunit